MRPDMWRSYKTATGRTEGTRRGDAKRLRHADPTVVGGTASNAHDDPLGSGLDRGENQLTKPIAGSAEWVALMFWDQREPDRGGRFHNRRRAVFDQGDRGVDWIAARASDAHRHSRTLIRR